MKKGVIAPERLIDIMGLDLTRIEQLDAKVRIGALAKNSTVSEDSLIKEKFPLLSMALAAGASQQIRHMATVGGNMLQRTRCGYFYNTDLPCNKREMGSGCGAIGGYNRMHAIFGASSSCIAVHPSDMCIALAALDATVLVQGKKSSRKILFTDFHRLPGDNPQQDNTLAVGELITGLEIPENRFMTNVHYLKVRDRSSYAFALISVAVAMELVQDKIVDIRLAMGGVAHKPWRLTSAEDFLRGKSATIENFSLAAKLAMTGARGYGENDFKLNLAPNSIVEALKVAASKS
jgi:xanthine dehydrogenase YagS FAD-binding subunit